MEQDSHGVVLVGGGWPGVIGFVKSVLDIHPEVLQTPHGPLRYKRVALDAFVLSQPTALLVLQGMPLQDLFPPDAGLRISDEPQSPYLVYGPFVFLKGQLSPRHIAPMRIDGVRLAAIEHVPPELTRDEVLALLLEDVIE